MLLALTVVTVNIASGIAALQLNEFGNETGAQLLFNFEEMKEYKTNAVQGTMDMLVALDRMIEGTPLRYEYVNGRTVTVTIAPPLQRAVDDELTRVLIADGCSFDLIPSQRTRQELGDVPGSCWCCTRFDTEEASCIALLSQNACSVYDSPTHRNFWTSGITSELVIGGTRTDQAP